MNKRRKAYPNELIHGLDYLSGTQSYGSKVKPAMTNNELLKNRDVLLEMQNIHDYLVQNEVTSSEISDTTLANSTEVKDAVYRLTRNVPLRELGIVRADRGGYTDYAGWTPERFVSLYRQYEKALNKGRAANQYAMAKRKAESDRDKTYASRAKQQKSTRFKKTSASRGKRNG